MQPAWVELEQFFASDARVAIDAVDCTLTQDLCSGNGVSGYPTVKAFFKGVEVDMHRGPRELSDLKQFTVTSIAKQA